MNTTFDSIFNDYASYMRVRLKPQSYRTSISRFKLYVLTYFKDYDIHTLTAKDIIKYQDYLMSLPYSYKYKKGTFYTLVSFLNFCRLFKGLNSNVAAEVGMYKNKYEIKKELNVWNYKEFTRFINVVEDPMYKVLYKFLFFTGCRLGEALALNFNDIKGNVLTINKTITKEYVNGKRMITPQKTKKSNRQILLDSNLLSEINKLHKHYSTLYKDFNNNYFIFGGSVPVSPTTIERKKNKYCAKARVKQIRLHDFRHSHATLLVNNNIPINIVADRLGHADINMTYSVYVHKNLENEKRVIKTLQSLQSIY